MKFRMTEQELDAGITVFASSKKALDEAVRTLGMAAVEYAVVNQNAAYCNKIITALGEKLGRVSLAWFTLGATPLTVTKGEVKVKFSYEKFNRVQELKGEQEMTPDNVGKFSVLLESLCKTYLEALSKTPWDATKEKKVRSADEEAAAAKTKRKNALKTLGIEEKDLAFNTQGAPATVPVPEDIQQLLDIWGGLSPKDKATVLNLAKSLESAGEVKEIAA